MADILVQGLTQNNLKHVTFRIPKDKITVFTGVSGSGKSSIVFDTIAAESQRQMNATYPAFVRAAPEASKTGCRAHRQSDGIRRGGSVPAGRERPFHGGNDQRPVCQSAAAFFQDWPTLCGNGVLLFL